MKLPFWNKDKRRLGEELLNQHFHLRLAQSEIDFIKKESADNCCSGNSIIRKLVKREMKGKEVPL